MHCTHAAAVREAWQCQSALSRRHAGNLSQIATHFSHSTVAKERLHGVPKTVQLPQRAIAKDVQTRQNSHVLHD